MPQYHIDLMMEMSHVNTLSNHKSNSFYLTNVLLQANYLPNQPHRHLGPKLLLNTMQDETGQTQFEP
jgi:hypothetical protein